MSAPVYEIRELPQDERPELLREIPEPPEQLWIAGTLPPSGYKLLTVVGSRVFSRYGQEACEHLISGLRGTPISIVSGLALGIDGIAHKAALSAGLHTLAIPGSGLDERVLYPASHAGLAREIVAQGGALLSEYEPTFKATKWSFPQRNRLMAGIAHATLIIEATTKSGTLITARLASEYNRELLVVPGSIFSGNSEGPHLFMKLGATPVTSPEDILTALHIEHTESVKTNTALSPEQVVLVAHLNQPRTKDELVLLSNMSPAELSGMLMQLELMGVIVDSGGMVRKRDI